jgi:hypothetical protein
MTDPGRVRPEPEKPREKVERHIVWVCAGCEECRPSDDSQRSSYPCENSPSMNGAEVVLAADYDRLAGDFTWANMHVLKARATQAESRIEDLEKALRGLIRVTQLPGTRAEIGPQMERAKAIARAALSEETS